MNKELYSKSHVAFGVYKDGARVGFIVDTFGNIGIGSPRIFPYDAEHMDLVRSNVQYELDAIAREEGEPVQMHRRAYKALGDFELRAMHCPAYDGIGPYPRDEAEAWAEALPQPFDTLMFKQ